jgi:prepilin-type N-terminal cleavage/methylation domain-containing protein
VVKRARRARGFTTIEIVVALSIFGVLVWILVALEGQMFRNERRFPINYMTHPEVMAVLARLRRDVVDSYGYPASYDKFQQGPQCLILSVVQPTGFSETVVWDFSKPTEARRLSFNVGQVSSDWLARGVPQFAIDNYSMPNGEVAVRVNAIDDVGVLAIDQIYQPRRH